MSRILVVGDDDAARYATAKLLATAGYKVVEAHDYHDAFPGLEDGTRYGCRTGRRILDASETIDRAIEALTLFLNRCLSPLRLKGGIVYS